MKPKIDLERLKEVIKAVDEHPQYCSNSRCIWPKPIGGMQTNGGCHCLDQVKDVKTRRAIMAASEGFKMLPDLIELLEEAKDVINGCVVMPTITGGFRENEAAKQWLSRFKKENKNA